MARPSGRIPPLTPSLDRVLPSKPSIVPDLRAEERLFSLYLDMKSQRDFWRDKARLTEKKFAAFRANRLAAGVGRAMKPSHNDSPSGRKVQ